LKSPVADIALSTMFPGTARVRPDQIHHFASLPALPIPSSGSFTEIFSRKIKLCMTHCCFIGPVDAEAIAIKSAALMELYDYLSHVPLQCPNLHSAEIDLLDALIRAHILRRIPDPDTRILDNPHLPAFTEPSWPHLSIVHKMLSVLLSLYPRRPIMLQMARDLVKIGGSHDPNERNAVGYFYITLLRVLPESRLFLADLFERTLLEVIRGEIVQPSLVSTALTVLHHILSDHPV
jgi:hypothetical protein